MAAYVIAMPAPTGDLAPGIAARSTPVETIIPAQAPPPHADAAIVSERAGDGLFYLTAAVNGHPVRFVMDTGASVVVLSAADAASAGINVAAPPSDGNDSRNAASHSLPETHVTTASGAVVMRWVRVGAITLGQRTFHDVPVAIAPGGSVSLVGQSLLAQLGTITLHGDQMEIR